MSDNVVFGFKDTTADVEGWTKSENPYKTKQLRQDSGLNMITHTRQHNIQTEWTDSVRATGRENQGQIRREKQTSNTYRCIPLSSEISTGHGLLT